MKPPSPSQSPSSPSPRAAGAHYALPDPRLSSAAGTPPRASDDACVVNDVDAFVRTIAAIRSKPAASPAYSSGSSGPDHLASVLSYYAARWLPDVASSPSGRFMLPPESPTATWLKKRLLLESLVAALPPDDADDRDDGITCDFLLRLLRAGSMVGADAALLGDLESRAARRLDQASLGAVMIPAFGLWHGAAAAHGRPARPCATLLDVPLVLRLVRGFLREGAKAGGGGAAAARVARLVDAYLAEAALESGLRPAEFEELTRAVPAHARAADDGLYRAVDTYLKDRAAYMFLLFPSTLLLLRWWIWDGCLPALAVQVYQAWLLFLYTSFALRDGSDIRPWWIYHHYLAMLMALVSLTWEIKGQADCSSKQRYNFSCGGQSCKELQCIYRIGTSVKDYALE